MTAAIKTSETKTSKRQKLKALQNNDLNKTPQQPRIKSAAQRAKTYILQSGLGLKSPSEKNKPQQLLDPNLDLDSPEVKFGRSLASSDANGRHKSVNKLKFYLKARCDISNENGGFSELDLMKLWKGLWYCLYMADKVPVQDELSKRISELIWCFEGTEEEDEYAARMYLDMYADEDEEDEELDDDAMMTDGEDADADVDDEDEDEASVTMEVVEDTISSPSDKYEEISEDENMEENEEDDEKEEEDGLEEPYLIKHCRGAHLAALFIRTFFVTVRREWGNMDKYRVDKFYTLIRLMMGQVYKYMAKRHWNYGITRLFNDHLYDEILSQIPNGIRYHIIDLALEQLAKMNKSYAPLPLTECTFVEVMDPFFGLCQAEQNPTVHSRVMENILKKFLFEYSVVGNKFLEENEGDEDENEKEEDYTLDNVHVGSISEFIFSLASHEDTKDKNRESLYAMYKMYEKRLKKVGKDVVMEDGIIYNGEADGQPIDSDSLEEGKDKENDKNGKATVKEAPQSKPEPIAEENEISTTKKSKRKKRKKKEAKEAKDETEKEEATKEDKVEPLEETIEEKTVQPKQETKKKKRKKRSKEESTEDNGASSSSNEKAEIESTSATNPETKDTDISSGSEIENKRRKKARKKKKKGQDDDVIVISTSDQKEAMEANSGKTGEGTKVSNPTSSKKKAEKKRKQSNIDAQENDDASNSEITEVVDKKNLESRRVSFGRMNYSKSYKASMKGLKTMDHPSTATRTPEKGILMKKLTQSKESTIASAGKKRRGKKNRKNASD